MPTSPPDGYVSLSDYLNDLRFRQQVLKQLIEPEDSSTPTEAPAFAMPEHKRLAKKDPAPK